MTINVTTSFLYENTFFINTLTIINYWVNCTFNLRLSINIHHPLIKNTR
jgi:hypothetical protein